MGRSERRAAAAVAVIVLAAAATLRAMGRSAICECGVVRLWAGEVRPAENSQQLADWYSLSHVVHGLLFYAAGWLAPRRWPVATRLVVALSALRDNLTLNVWMLVAPSPAIVRWQAGA